MLAMGFKLLERALLHTVHIE